MESAARQIGASLSGAQSATKAYMAGQAEMAQNAQRAASEGYVQEPRGVGQHVRSGYRE